MSSSTTRFLQQENIRLTKELETLETDKKSLFAHLEMVKELFWAGQNIASEENLLYALNQLLYKVMQVIEANDGSISYFDQAANELIFVLVHGELGRQLAGFRIKGDTGIAGWVVENKESIIVNDPRQDWRFSETVDKEFSFFTQSIVSVPIISKNSFMGVVQLLNKRGNNFDEADVALLLILGHVAAKVLDEIQRRIDTGEASQEDFFLVAE